MIIPYLTQANSPFLSKNNTGLGNALFQIFTAYGISKKFNIPFNNYYIIELLIKLKSFNLNHRNTIFRNLQTFSPLNNNTITLNEKTNYYSLYDKELINKIHNIYNKKDIIIKGYFQSHIYFDNYYNDILKLISPDSNSINIIKTTYPHLFDDNIINISLHFRLNWCKNLQYNNNFYFEAVNYITAMIKDIKSKKIILNIFGDDISKIKKLFKHESFECIYFENNPDYIDLWCMSLCKFNIISNSTLSWWAAYINTNKDKIVIYPEDILRLLHATIHDKPMLPERKIQHYKSEWVPLKTKNVIFQ